ncbi:hypothetical protein CLV52_1557 [Amnibacterium kyonggiense]|uniref:Uncharacterized protein n=1 Tax=Amnibacterium kyonggiense TaxID=595671 RepID=A0A4R7FSY0_9MICO|nr:hypothetical protein CLV52_1557 [Amnibacterium kyonggiense]
MSPFVRTPVRGTAGTGGAGTTEGAEALGASTPSVVPCGRCYFRAFGRRNSAPSGGSVSTTEAGWPWEGSASATAWP